MSLFFKSCTIIDGSGAPPFTGDILVSGDRIAQVGRTLCPPVEAEVIDCKGLTATPGFIDCHSHNDWFALSADHSRYFDPFLLQGITTFVAGNCGYSVAGYRENSPHQHEIGNLFERDAGSSHFSRFAPWFDAVDNHCPVNVACLAGHGTARIGVNGQKNTPLSASRRAAMLEDLEQALLDGAGGISLGLMYEPGLYASYDELADVARLCARYDRILTVHPRAESNISMSYSSVTRSHLLLALAELDRLVRETGVRFQHSHLIFAGRKTWKVEKKAVAVLEKLKTDGFDVAFDMYPLDYGVSIITVVLPDWYQAMTVAERRRPVTHLRLAVMVHATTRLLGFGFSDIRIAYGGESQKDIIGKSVSEIARSRGVAPLKAYLDICEKSDFKATVLMGAYQNDEIIRDLMANDMSLFMSDAWVHRHGKQNGGIYGALPRFIELGRKMGQPIEQTIAKMTGRSAARFKLKDRGLIAKGNYADLNFIDLAALRTRIDEELPPLGIRSTYINGQLVARNGTRSQSNGITGRAIRVH
jgi:N-acyl-D-amino-acid deacylase